MNNKPENVPIATLSGLASITDVLKELPLPGLSQDKDWKESSLLSTPTELQNAFQLLNGEQLDSSLIARLQHYLGKVNTQYLDFKTLQRSVENPNDNFPILLQQLLASNPDTFTPNHDQYAASPTKLVQYTPRQGPLQPHGHPMILSPSRSGHHIPVAHVSPLQKSQLGAPVAHVSPYNVNRYQAQQQQQISSPSSRKRPSLHEAQGSGQGKQKLSPVASASALARNEGGQVEKEQDKDVTTLSTRRRRSSSISSRELVRRQLYEESKHQEQGKHDEVQETEKKEEGNNIELSPGSLKISINKDNLKERPSGRLSLSRRSLNKKYETSESETETRPLANNQIPSRISVDGSVEPVKSPIIDPSMLDVNSIQVMRPVIPKIIVKKVRRKEGSKEFETMEIISPVKERPDDVDMDEQQDYMEEPEHNENVSEVKRDVTKDLPSKTWRHYPKRAPQTTVPKAMEVDKEPVQEVAEGRTLRRKRIRCLSSGSDQSEESLTDALQEGILKKPKRNKLRMGDEDFVVRTDVRRLLQVLQEILDTEEELEADGVLNFGEDNDVPPDSLLSRPLVTEFYMEISKLKSSDLASQVPHDRLVGIISIMDRHVRECANVSLAQPKVDDDDEEKLWKGLAIDRVLRASEAALIILHITTAPGMPKQVYMEEAIEHVVSFCKFQLENTIYPDYDPVYRVNPDKKFDHSAALPKTRRSRSSQSSTKQKPVLQLYNKICELVSLIGDLVSIESLNDMIILQASSIGTSPFFVENVSILQLEALKLVRTIFRTYVKHRDLILEDILASLARLPSSKRNLRNYRLFEDTSIQMVTALVLQLVQCTVNIPDTFEKKEEILVDKDVMIVTSYEDALRAAQNFLATFLKKCSTASRDENDFRPLFENLLHDILTTLNKPEWPAAEVLLALLGKLLIMTFNNKSNEMSLRVAAIDYLALIASHLRRDAVDSREKDKGDLREIIQQLISEDDIEDEISVDMIDIHVNTLRKALLSFLSSASEVDSSCKFSREFYLGQWIRDVHTEMERCMKAPMMSIPGAASSEIPTDDGEASIENIQELDEKKQYYHSLATGNTSTSYRSSQQKLSYQEATIVSKYLSSTRSFSQSFDIYLQQIFKMLNETAVALRTKAVKALTAIVSVDPSILAREDVQVSVHGRFRDHSTLVREAAVDLIGQFVLKCPELTEKYYDMIMERILDTGISVRKRLIKILRDICIEQPEFPKIPEICVKIIRRVNDEEGIRDLVTKVFQKMWFTPVTGSCENNVALRTKALNIMKVVEMCKDGGYEWFETLLDNLFESDDEYVKKSTIKACQQLTDSLVQRLLKIDQDKGVELIACLTTLYLLSKIRPQLLVDHAATFQPYLSIKCKTQRDAIVIQNVAKILENVVPLVEHPNPKFLADLEEDLMKLVIKQGQNIVQSCVCCLDAVINQVTHNYKFVSDCFKKFHDFLAKARNDQIAGKSTPGTRPALLRALFSAGLLCQHFDFDKQMEDDKKKSRSLDVLEICLFFTKHSDEEVRLKAIMAVGFICVCKPEYLLRNECKELYQKILCEDHKLAKEKSMLLKGLQNHLMEDEARVIKLEGRKKKDRKQKKESDIKDFGDAQSGTTSAVMQVLLNSILGAFFETDALVRLAAVQVVALILRQGLMHPAQCVPYLIAAGTDENALIKTKAEQSLADINNRHSGFIHMKAVQGIKLSYKLQKVVQCTSDGYLQGFKEGDSKSSLVSHVYTMLRGNKQYRRTLLQTILKQFDNQKSPIDMLYFFTENLAYLPYITQEEPLFVMHHCDVMVSLTGAGHLQSFQEIFFPSRKGKGKGKSPRHNMDDDDELENEERLNELQVDVESLQTITSESFGCMLLLELKHFLKQLYGFADSKCQKYSPSEPTKLYDKSLTRRGEITFNSMFRDLMFKEKPFPKDEIVNYYLQFKQLILSLDSEEDSEETEPKQTFDTSPDEEMVPQVEVTQQEATQQKAHQQEAHQQETHQQEAPQLEAHQQASVPTDEPRPSIAVIQTRVTRSSPTEDRPIERRSRRSYSDQLKSSDDDTKSEGSTNSRATRRSSRGKRK